MAQPSWAGDARVADFKTALGRVEKGQSYEDWTRKHPTAACGPFESSIYVKSVTEQWCYVCTHTTPDTETTYGFYFDPEKNLCTLQQFGLEFRRGPYSEIRDEVERTMSQRIGHQTTLPGQIWESGSAYWKNVIAWNIPSDVAYAFSPREANDGVLWRWPPLKDRKHFDPAEHRALRESEHKKTTELYASACQEAGLSNCLAKANASDKSFGYKPTEMLAYFKEAWNQLNVVKKSDPRYPALVIWIGYLWPGCVNKDEMTTQLQELGLEIGESDREGCRAINTPIPDISTEWLENRWGRQAFLEKLHDKSGMCGAEDAKISAVIDQADDYLKRYPKSEISEAVRLERAAAYESWWSAQLFKKHDLPSNDSRLPKARERAIQLYEEYLKDHPGSNDIKQRLYYLHHNIDTEHRSYYCDPESYC